LVDRFWTILGGILAGLIVPEHLFQGFHPGHPVQTELFGDSQSASSPAPACSHRVGLDLWVLSGLRIVLDDVIDGTVKDHEPAASLAITSARVLSAAAWNRADFFREATKYLEGVPRKEWKLRSGCSFPGADRSVNPRIEPIFLQL